MKLQTKYPKVYENLTLYFSTLIRILLNAVLAIILIAITIGVYKTAVQLFHEFGKPVDQELRQLLIDIIPILALVEIYKTILSYLQEGWVHITYIVDTVLIVMLNEVVSLWFTHPKMESVIEIAILIVVLIGTRLLSITFSPSRSSADTKLE